MWSIRKLINKRKHVDTENRVGKKEPVEGRWNQCFLNKRSFINVKLKSLCNMNPNLLVHTYIFIVIQCVHVNLCWFFHLFFHVSISTCWKSYILFHQIKVIVFLLLGTWIVFQNFYPSINTFSQAFINILLFYWSIFSEKGFWIRVWTTF